MFAMAVIGICIGRISGRNGKSVSRTENPTMFWFCVGAYFAGGIGFLGYYFYKAGVFSN
jgi:hypothetical protein